jgi:hypothetical protein
MPSPLLAALSQQVAQTETVIASAVVLINGIAARVQTAVDAALANGATAAELAPLQNEIDVLNASTAILAAAVANVPAVSSPSSSPSPSA